MSFEKFNQAGIPKRPELTQSETDSVKEFGTVIELIEKSAAKLAGDFTVSEEVDAAEELRQMLGDTFKEGAEGINALDKLIEYLEDTIRMQRRLAGVPGAESEGEFNLRLQALTAATNERGRRMLQASVDDHDTQPDNVEPTEVFEKESDDIATPVQPSEQSSEQSEMSVKVERTERYNNEAEYVERLAKFALELPKFSQIDPEKVQGLFVEEIANLCHCETEKVIEAIEQNSDLYEQARVLGISESQQFTFDTLRMAQLAVRIMGEEGTKKLIEEQLQIRYGIESMDLSEVSNLSELRKLNVDIISTEETSDRNLHGKINKVYRGGYYMPGYVMKDVNGHVVREITKDIGVRPRVSVYKYNNQ